jgi:two-component system, NarL family, nitrate/nitrite response regulator NarL
MSIDHAPADAAARHCFGGGARILTCTLDTRSSTPNDSAQPHARILLVDDHDLVREGLAVVIDRESGMKIVGCAKTGEEAVAAARRLQPDVIVMDLVLPHLNGIDATRRITDEFPLIHVLALSSSQTLGLIQRTLGAGARGYVSKSADATEIVRAITTVLAGGRYLSSKVSSALVAELMLTAPGGPLACLSRRETEILRLVVAGCTSAEIANRLFISHKTVETYRSRMMVKLGVDSRAALIRLTLEYELPTV